MKLCNYCGEEVGGIGFGDEVLDYCHACDLIVEGETHDSDDTV